VIRIALPKDRTSILRMLNDYRQASPLEFHKTSDIEHAGKIVDAVIAGGGVCFVAEDSKCVHGMLLAIKNPNIWDPTVLALHELAYWVDPDMRGSSAGYKLLKMYRDYAQEQKTLGLIGYYTISKMVTSPDLDYSRFGFNKLEEMWRA